MKIAMHADGPTIRGNERQLLRLTRGLRERGHEIAVSCRAGTAVEEAFRKAGARTTGVRPRGDADLFHALRFAGWLRAQRADAVLLTSWQRAFVSGWAARVAGSRRVVLRVGGTHRVPPGVGGWKHRHTLERYVDAVMANCQGVAERLRGDIPRMPAERVAVVPNGIEPLAPPEPAPLRAQLAIPAPAVLLATVSGMEPNKGHDLLLRALAALGDPLVHLLMVGDGRHRPTLEGLAGALGIADRVHWLGHRGDVPSVLAAADGFALASHAEGLAVSMLEAGRARLPIAVTRVGGTWELIEARHGRPAGGWVAPLRDVGGIADALASLVRAIRDGSARARAEEAHWRVTNWYNAERMVDGAEALLMNRPLPEWT